MSTTSDSWTGWITAPPGEEIQLAVSGQVYLPPGTDARLTKKESPAAKELHLELTVADPDADADEAIPVRYDEQLESGDEYEVFFVWDAATGDPIVDRQVIERVPWKG